MRRGGGHSKGAAWEREVAKKIVKAFKPFGIEQRDCWRSVLSGGHQMSFGDLVMTEKLLRLFPFAVECKFNRKIDWWHYLVHKKYRSDSWKEWLWVKQACEGGLKGKRFEVIPLLVIKENHGPTLAIMLPHDCSVPDNLTGQAFEFNDFLKRVVRVAKKREEEKGC